MMLPSLPAGANRSFVNFRTGQVNEFQGRIRDTTRRMMATVSELSMHQATALKLQQEKMARERELQEAK